MYVMCSLILGLVSMNLEFSTICIGITYEMQTILMIIKFEMLFDRLLQHDTDSNKR